jgi:DNA-binding NtrC family response regulator
MRDFRARASALRMHFARAVTRPLRILVADPDAEVRRLIALVLVADGCDVLMARDHAELLRIARVDRWPDVVVCDVEASNDRTFAPLELIRRADDSLPVIVTTRYIDSRTRAEAGRVGAAALFEKPCDLRALCRAVNDTAQAHREARTIPG